MHVIVRYHVVVYLAQQAYFCVRFSVLRPKKAPSQNHYCESYLRPSDVVLFRVSEKLDYYENVKISDVDSCDLYHPIRSGYKLRNY